MNLPQEFLTELEKILGDEIKDYLDSFNYSRSYGLRFNTLKISNIDNFIKNNNLKLLDKIPWTKNGYYYDENYRPSKEPLYYAGLYYLQEPSAMCPASYLPINDGDVVLDMCAAPGGKTTEIVSKLNNTGYLVANDISTSRCKALIKNLEIWGSKNILVTSEDCYKLSKKFPKFFDKILLDAPCSGEGMFRKEQKMINAWIEHGPKYFAPIQKSLLKNAYDMLKDNGYILYSTCTYSRKEDEENLEWLLDKYNDLEIVSLKDFNGAFHPNITNTKYESINNTIKFFPHRIKGEGHFVSLIHKKSREDYKSNLKKSELLLCDITKNYKKFLTDEAFEFLNRVKMTVNKDDIIVVREEKVFLQNNNFSNINNIRILRNGLFLGTIKKKRFEPSQAFAMCLDTESFDNVLSLKNEDDRIIKYLKGETINIQDKDNIKDGYVLVCINSFPLGFGKLLNGKIKNKYLSSWRYN